MGVFGCLYKGGSHQCMQFFIHLVACMKLQARLSSYKIPSGAWPEGNVGGELHLRCTLAGCKCLARAMQRVESAHLLASICTITFLVPLCVTHFALTLTTAQSVVGDDRFRSRSPPK